MSEGLQMKYFVLKPRGNNLRARASREAIRLYAKLIRPENAQLAEELENWVDSPNILVHDDHE